MTNMLNAYDLGESPVTDSEGVVMAMVFKMKENKTTIKTETAKVKNRQKWFLGAFKEILSSERKKCPLIP